MTRWLTAIVALLVVSACDSAGPGALPAAGPSASNVGCPDRLDAAVDLLASGLPTYNFEPAVDVDALVARSDVVIAGRLDAVERSTFELHGDSLDSSTIVSGASDVEVLVGDIGTVSEFDIASSWPSGVGPDPLASAVELVDVRFVAFVVEFPGSTALTVDVQGLFVACGDGPVQAVIEPAPPGSGTTINELIAAVRTVD